MIENDWKWSKMIEHDRKWLKMIEHDWKWLKMIENDWLWLKMIENDWNESLSSRSWWLPSCGDFLPFSSLNDFWFLLVQSGRSCGQHAMQPHLLGDTIGIEELQKFLSFHMICWELVVTCIMSFHFLMSSHVISVSTATSTSSRVTSSLSIVRSDLPADVHSAWLRCGMPSPHLLRTGETSASDCAFWERWEGT